MAGERRFVRLYGGLFHLAQATIHDRWVKGLRFVAFLAGSALAIQIVLRSALGYVGLQYLLPSSALAIAIASAVWLVAYPAMWIRMLTVIAEMEAKKEFKALLHEIQKLHHRHPGRTAVREPPRAAPRQE